MCSSDLMHAFNGCHNLQSVVIPQGVTEIDFDAFAHCGLTSVEIPDTVTRIGSGAFGWCKKLASVTIPDTVTEIRPNAFLGVPHIIYNGPAESDDNWGALRRN